jgi:FlaA1/EpsC-like NDP-sugar epimerase
MKFLRNRSFQLLVDAMVVGIALVLAYAMRFEGFPPRVYYKQLFLLLPYLVLLRIGILALFGVYRLVWRYVSLRDLPRILLAATAGTGILLVARFGLAPLLKMIGIVVNPLYVTVPFGVLAGELVLTTIGIIAVRGLWRLLKEEESKRATDSQAASSSRQKALLIGAGSAGVMVAREVGTNPQLGFQVVGFLDDDPDKHGTVIHGFKVMGGTDRMSGVSRALGADLAVISMARVPASSIRRIVGLAEEAGLKVQIIPGLYDILNGKVNISKIRDVAIEDLLGRKPVQLDQETIQKFVTGKRVLVSGAGGSIGSEICRQICRFGPLELTLMDQAENPLFHIHRELLTTFPDMTLAPIVGNVANRRRMKQVIGHCRPEVVFHAAAHKHVPLMEQNPGEAVRNNIHGSRNLADLAHEFLVEAFVMISTDKAVNPKSVMGASKRFAEMYIQALSAKSNTRFITVRFGNVLGSEGSVVPIFKEQIARGGPVTVTHPEMKRYFMTIPEASQLVLQASVMGKGGEIFILEMGDPILIVNLARDLIRLSGFQPDEDIKIAYSGMRPGEKLYEEINLSEEHAAKTKHPRIWIGSCGEWDSVGLASKIDKLVDMVTGTSVDPAEIRRALSDGVPEYRPTDENGDIVSGLGKNAQDDAVVNDEQKLHKAAVADTA